jgi:hypothetical protein
LNDRLACFLPPVSPSTQLAVCCQALFIACPITLSNKNKQIKLMQLVAKFSLAMYYLHTDQSAGRRSQRGTAP